MTESELPLRQAVRALMINHRDEVLLVKLNLRGWEGWVMPGGGIEAGEEIVDALRRELLEETGLTDPFIGPVVCLRRQVGSFIPEHAGQFETIHMVPCHGFEPRPAFTQDELRAEGIIDMRWFSLDDIRHTTDRVVPGRLVKLVERVLEFGGSVEPMFIDVTVKGR